MRVPLVDHQLFRKAHGSRARYRMALQTIHEEKLPSGLLHQASPRHVFRGIPLNAHLGNRRQPFSMVRNSARPLPPAYNRTCSCFSVPDHRDQRLFALNEL